MNLIRKIEYLLTRESKWATELQQIEDKVEQEIDGLLEGKDDTALEVVLTTLKDRRSNLSIQAEFTPLVVSICGQILAFGSAGVGLMVAFANKIPAFTLFWKNIISIGILFYFDAMVIALVALVLFF